MLIRGRCASENQDLQQWPDPEERGIVSTGGDGEASYNNACRAHKGHGEVVHTRHGGADSMHCLEVGR